MAKKGRKGQKKIQGTKARAVQKAKKVKVSKGKAKSKTARKSQTKAIKSNLKKMSFDNNKKIEVLNSDITKVLLAPPKLSVLSFNKTNQKQATTQKDVPDVGQIAQKLAQM